MVVTFSLFIGADLAGEFDSRDEALRALRRLAETDPAAAGELAVVERDAAGEPLGEPITTRPAAAA